MTWDLGQAEEHLLSLERSGMNFGLERMRRLLAALGSPQDRFRAVHVVGTNGKSSTVRYTAALLEAHGVRTGEYLSPHLTSFTERIRVGGADLAADAFAAAVERVAAVVDEDVTQFELLTAVALDELARQGVEVAVIEAGLGGRRDATNVLRAKVVVLTNVGLEHTRFLGETVAEIAADKLAVVRAGATLILGADQPEVRTLAEGTGARIVRPASAGIDAPGYQKTNLTAAVAAAEAILGAPVKDAAIPLAVPGRLQIVDHDPLTLLDGAHNAPGMAALLDSVPHGTVAVLSVLEDKDLDAMLQVLLPRLSAVVCTQAPNPRALVPETLERAVAGLAPALLVEVAPDPRAAVSRARDLAGESGTVLVTGSIYLVADLLSAPGARRASVL
jgi:dihydrofolate synthase/folylpolyglutamate synthase